MGNICESKAAEDAFTNVEAFKEHALGADFVVSDSKDTAGKDGWARATEADVKDLKWADLFADKGVVLADDKELLKDDAEGATGFKLGEAKTDAKFFLWKKASTGGDAPKTEDAPKEEAEKKEGDDKPAE